MARIGLMTASLGTAIAVASAMALTAGGAC